MHSLVVVAHPGSDSLTHEFAREVSTALAGDGRTAELADLAAEGFDPRFTVADLLHYRGTGATPPDVRAEQTRLDRAQQIILVFPVYWWSMPALLKGWIDRVFVDGWAFEYSDEGDLMPRLAHLGVHLLAIAGAEASSYCRRGYTNALRTQIEQGIFGFCGAAITSSRTVHDSESTASDLLARQVTAAAKHISMSDRGRAGLEAPT